MHYQIFLPGVTVPSHTKLAEFGLERLESPNMSILGPEGTPFGEGGALCSWVNGIPFNPLWLWQKVGDYWVGFDRNDRPTPADLRRSTITPGADVLLSDGLKWHFPHHRKVEHSFQIDPDTGSITRAPVPEMKPFIDRCSSAIETIYTALGLADIWEAFEHKAGALPEENKIVTVKDGFSLVVEGLSMNYRINEAIAVVLDLLDDTTVRTAMVNIIELPAIHDELTEQDLKKKQGLEVSVNVTQPI